MNKDVREQLRAVQEAARYCAKRNDWGHTQFLRIGGKWYVRVVAGENADTLTYDGDELIRIYEREVAGDRDTGNEER